MTSQWKNPTFVRSNHFIIQNSSAKDEFDLPKININSNNAIKILAIQKRCENAGTRLAGHTQAIEPIGIHSVKHRTVS